MPETGTIGRMTPKQRSFAQHYAESGSAHASALAAGYSEQYAKSNSSKQLLQNPEVIAEIKRIREVVNKQADRSATDVVNEFSKIAFTDRVDFLKPDPLIEGDFIYKAPDELTKNQRAIVEKVTYNVREVVVITKDGVDTVFRQEYNYILSDKAKALEQMGRHFGIFDDKLRLGVQANNPFKNASPKQLEKLKASWIKTMGDQPLIEDAQYEEVNNAK